jgi:hypothetical protein
MAARAAGEAGRRIGGGNAKGAHDAAAATEVTFASGIDARVKGNHNG